MSEKFLSDDWYRVAQLRPRLLPHVRIFRQRYRRRAWYVLQDPASGRVHRFPPATYAVINRLDGAQTLDQLWNGLAETLGDHAPTQDEVIHLMYQLHAADVLQGDMLPDVEEALTRKRRQVRSKWLRSLGNPLSLRIPLWDPQRFLDASWPTERWALGPLGAVLWMVVVGLAGLLAAQHWELLNANFADRVLGQENLFWLWLSYPIVKLCHELAHAWALKRGGGETHEMGVMFLMFVPVPYVDATAAAAFRAKWSRILVSAAGILAELLLAAIALFVWLAAEPGAVRAIAFNVMLIGGVSTVLFNANPLLRFDGYYILVDLLEIPNLAQRSNQYLVYLVKRHVFGVLHGESPAHGRDESFWMALYGPLSWAYRLAVMLGISLFVASHYFFAGVLMALWSVGQTLVWPVAKGLHFVFRHGELDRVRRRAVWSTGGALVALTVVCGVVPVSDWTNAEGVVWVPANAEVRAATGGFVSRLLTKPGSRVVAGEPLVELTDSELATELVSRRARVEQLEVQLATEMYTDRLQAELTRQTLAVENSAAVRLARRVDDLVVAAARDGDWDLPNPRDQEGRHYEQGALIGYVLSGSLDTIRVVVRQEDADIVRQETHRIAIKLVDRPLQTFDAVIAREVPGGSDLLPSKALTLDGGGTFATDPRGADGLKTLVRTFQFDLAVTAVPDDLRFGTRALVKFEHSPRPIAAQLYRHARQVLLGRLGV